MVRSFLLYLSIFLAAFALNGFSAEEDWQQNFEKVKKQAAVENKNILVYFCASDWCLSSIQFGKEVLFTEEFHEKVKDDFVLMRVDFPQQKEQSARLKAQNKELSEKYGVMGFPALLFADTKGNPYYFQFGRISFELMMIRLEEVAQIEEEFSARMKSLEVAKGEERYRLVGKMFSHLPDAIVSHYYGDLIEEVMRDDYEDVSGLRLKERKAIQLEEVSQFIEKIADAISETPTQVINSIEQYALRDSLFEESKQFLMAHTAYIMVMQGRADEAIERLGVAIRLADTPLAENLKNMREAVKRYKDEIEQEAVKWQGK